MDDAWTHGRTEQTMPVDNPTRVSTGRQATGGKVMWVIGLERVGAGRMAAGDWKIAPKRP